MTSIVRTDARGTMKTDRSGIVAVLKAGGTILLSVHKSPDGDALGSQLALKHALEARGAKVRAHNLDPVPEIYRFLPGAQEITSGQHVAGRYDALVVLDSEPARTGLFSDGYPATNLINIDHHITNSREWPMTWLEPDATATGEMVYHLIRDMEVPISREMAVCLFTAIFTDTGSFRYSNTSPDSMRIAAALIEAGADPWTVTEHVYESFAFRRLKLMGLVLAGIEQSADGRTAWVTVTEDQYRLTGATAEDTDNFVNYVRSVRGVEVAVLFRQTGPAQFKISLRSKGRVDLTAVAQSMGGGGHKNAAGGVLDGPFNVVRERVLGAIQHQINEQIGNVSSAPTA